MLAFSSGREIMSYRPYCVPGAPGMVAETRVTFEFSNLDGLSSVERILPDAKPWKPYNALGRIVAGGANVTVPLERLLFGSNAPFMPLEQSLFKLIESPLTRTQIDAMAFRNAGRILGRA